GGLSRWNKGIKPPSTSWFQDTSPSERIIEASFNLELSMGIFIIASRLITIRSAWNLPGKGKMQWTRSVDADGRSLRTGNSRGEFIFMQRMTQGSLWKERDEQ